MPQSINDFVLVKIHFSTVVRFGDGRSAMGLDSAKDSLPSDSLYAAFMSETVRNNGVAELERIKKQIESNQILLSALMPCYIDHPADNISNNWIYCVPRPFAQSSAEHKHEPGSPSIKKVLKKVPWLPVDQMFPYLNFVEYGEGDVSNFGIPQSKRAVLVNFDRVNTRDMEEPQPYTVSAYRFPSEISALYFVAYVPAQEDKDWLIQTLNTLSDSGIGGKTSSGMGKFTFTSHGLEENKSSKALWMLISNKDANCFMSLGSIIPNAQEDMETLRQANSRYLLETRDGFTSSPDFVSPTTQQALKRKRCVLIQSGSCFEHELKGSVVDLSYGQLHPVYRVGKSLQIGLDYEYGKQEN